MKVIATLYYSNFLRSAATMIPATTMLKRITSALCVAVAFGVAASSTLVTTASAQSAVRTTRLAVPVLPERAVRRDISLVPAIRKAYAAGTRDSSGAPGRRYWQQRVDYRINATVDAPSGTIRGNEVITLHNSSPDSLRQIVVRLYQNYFKATSQRNDYVTDITDGVVLERLAVNGSAITLTDAKSYALNGTIATVTPAAVIAPGADATVEATWHFVVPRVDTTERGERMGRYDSVLFQVAQWYPQIAMYDDLHGWDTDQYMG
ncbi:MAG: hypothetical protein M3Z30_05770, partial [Gemmatimonadota bacterium]|nr:hypothetical protein [Gemmatimonadota bacterium]